MIKYEYGGFEIEVFDENTSSIESSDKRYDIEYAVEDYPKYQSSSKHVIRVLKEGKIIKSAILIGTAGATIIDENSTILDEDNLVVGVSNYLFCLKIPDLGLKWKVEVDTACCLEVFKINDGYIVHGELAISKVSKGGRIEWRAGGKDIFVTVDGSDSFEVKKEYIYAKDFEDNTYKIDFNGKVYLEPST
jgi:hypothetical protein